MKYRLEIDMENGEEPTIDQAEKAAKAAAKILPGSMLFWMISQEITSTEPIKYNSPITERRKQQIDARSREYQLKINRAKVLHAQGYTNKEIAETMGLSESTVRDFISHTKKDVKENKGVN